MYFLRKYQVRFYVTVHEKDRCMVTRKLVNGKCDWKLIGDRNWLLIVSMVKYSSHQSRVTNLPNVISYGTKNL